MQCNVSTVKDLEKPDEAVALASVTSSGETFSISLYSDLHIGIPGDKANDFDISDDAFVKHLEDELAGGVDCIILLGDVLELWEVGAGATSPTMRFEDIKKARPKLFAFFSAHIGKDVFYVAGNHDGATTSLLHASLGLRLTFPSSGGTLFATHGHFVDEDNKPGSDWTGRIGTAFRAVVERHVHPKADEALMQIADRVGRSGDPKLYEEWGDQLAREFDFSMVVMGHTHKPVISDKLFYHYVNTGNGEEVTRQGKVLRTSFVARPSKKTFDVSQTLVVLNPKAGIKSGCCSLQ
eukprot:Hpha_TRINITY_DN16637_c1_g8::TRINITY_DN16637_c1_g8_i1::g.179158::m.179158